jgi:hypothetical protein
MYLNFALPFQVMLKKLPDKAGPRPGDTIGSFVADLESGAARDHMRHYLAALPPPASPLRLRTPKRKLLPVSPDVICLSDDEGKIKNKLGKSPAKKKGRMDESSQRKNAVPTNSPLRNGTPRTALVTFGVKKLSPCVAGNALEEPDPSSRNTGMNRSAAGTGISPPSVHNPKRETSCPGQAIPTLISQASRVERGNTEEEKAIPVLPSTHVEDSQSTDRPPSGPHSSHVPPQYQYPAPSLGASYAESSYSYPSGYEYSGPPPSYYYPPPSHWPPAANPPQGEELVQTASYATPSSLPAPPLLEHRPAPSLIQIATTGENSVRGTLRGRRASSETVGQRSQQAWVLPTSSVSLSVLPAATTEKETPNIAAASAARPAKRPLMSLPRPVSAGRGLPGSQPST